MGPFNGFRMMELSTKLSRLFFSINRFKYRWLLVKIRLKSCFSGLKRKFKNVLCEDVRKDSESYVMELSCVIILYRERLNIKSHKLCWIMMNI